jgi:hypothetical protein
MSGNGADDDDGYQYMILPLSKYVPMVVLQMVTSLTSIGSSVIVLRIAGPKLGSTYQRYLFALSATVIVNSIFLFLHPLLVPSEDRTNGSGAYWAVGNSVTCSVAGFFLVFGALAVSLYSNALALYFYFSIQTSPHGGHGLGGPTKRPRDPEDVIGWPERIANLACWVAPAAIAGTGVAMDSYHYDPRVEMCVLFTECDYSSSSSSSDCVPTNFDPPGRYGVSSAVILQSTFQWTLVASAALGVLVTARIQCQVRWALGEMRKQMMLREEQSPPTQTPQRGGNNDNSAVDQEEAAAAEGDDNDQRHQMGQKLAAVSAQCLLYTLSYMNSYVWFVAVMFVPSAGGGGGAGGGDNGNLFYAFQLVAAIFYPAFGFFNCVIYIRPRVQMLQIMYRQDPFVVVLRVAMSRAGDPDEIEQIRADIYGSEYSGSVARGDGHHDNNDDEEDDLFSRDSAIPSVVHFDPTKPVSIKSLVSTPGGAADNDDDRNSTVSALGLGGAFPPAGGDGETSGDEVESQ